IPLKVKRSVIPSTANCARFYALPKVHKAGIPFRPIVSNIGTASYKLAKYLVSVFSPLRSQNLFTVKHSTEFVEKIPNFAPNNSFMASFDVNSLFTNVPVEGSLLCLKSRLSEFHFTSKEIDELIFLTRICLKQCSFVFNGRFYTMVDGLAMENPLSPILSDIYMHYFEVKLFQKLQFQFYVRYVDDCFVLMNHNDLNVDEVLVILNSIDSHIQFSYELEQNNCLPFLDVLVSRTESCFETTVYRKPFSVSLP
ncbi:uncharacterized protein LOC129220094, partial [Uloborus diversus]|uniref:uncharacterized protein LOC129220094 n=1 Tax=Uloborus diversus TaxID=327109 RepID=UPI002409AF35